jgi:hypothetical protein
MTQVFGCKERTESKVGDGRFKVYDEVKFPLIPRSEWQDTNQLQDHMWRQIFQGPQLSCAGAFGCGVLQIARRIAGLDDIPLSQAVPYALCNGGRDSGASIDSILTALTDVGTVSTDLIDQYNWRGFRSPGTDYAWPAGWQKEAGLIRIDESWDCPTIDHLMTGIQLGFVGGGGIYWKYPRRQGGHALPIVGCRNRNPVVLHSWEGYKYQEMPYEQWKQGIPIFGGWLIRSVVHPEATP